MTELHEMDAHQLSAALNSQEVSCVEVAQHFLDRISSDSHGAFITVTADSALAQAAAVDATAITERPTFAGVPMAAALCTPLPPLPSSVMRIQPHASAASRRLPWDQTAAGRSVFLRVAAVWSVSRRVAVASRRGPSLLPGRAWRRTER